MSFKATMREALRAARTLGRMYAKVGGAGVPDQDSQLIRLVAGMDFGKRAAMYKAWSQAYRKEFYGADGERSRRENPIGDPSHKFVIVMPDGRGGQRDFYTAPTLSNAKWHWMRAYNEAKGWNLDTSKVQILDAKTRKPINESYKKFDGRGRPVLRRRKNPGEDWRADRERYVVFTRSANSFEQMARARRMEYARVTGILEARRIAQWGNEHLSARQRARGMRYEFQNERDYDRR